MASTTITQEYVGWATTLFFQINTANAAPYAFTLPKTPDFGDIVVVKDVGGAAATNPITVSGGGGATIDGAATYVMNVNYESITFYYTGVSWLII